MKLDIAHTKGTRPDPAGVLENPEHAVHGGDRQALARRFGVPAGDIIDFSASINPLGPPEWLRREISRVLADVAHYPEPRSESLCEFLAKAWGLPVASVAAGNGANEWIYALPRLSRIERVVIPAPAYVDYSRAARAAGKTVLNIQDRLASTPAAPLASDILREESPPRNLADALLPGDLIYLGHPGNPTGELLDRARLVQLVRSRPDVLFAIDEAFLEFIDDAPVNDAKSLSLLGEVSAAQNLVVLRSFTKFFAVPGLRLGCIAASPQLVRELSDLIPDWSVNFFAQSIAPRLLADHDYACATRSAVAKSRAVLIEGLRSKAALQDRLEVVSGRANYLLLRLRDAAPMSAREFAERLLARDRIAVRACDNFEGLGGADTRYLRIAVRTDAENEVLLQAFADALRGEDREAAAPELKADDATKAGVASRAAKAQTKLRTPSKTPALMLQGTSSNAGKSVMTAAFCRIFLQDGLRVAPFKSQNMSLNSYVTSDGREIARAQAVQAAACRLAPDIRMSPVLLKPGSETGSQVLVSGRPVGHMSALEYQTYKATAFETVRESYDSLCDEYDVIVLEGAGSPGEVNLKQNDIVNMRMAEYAEAAVLLVGDIDRGGVFAGFVGTLEVLAEWERKLVIGYLVNRFRGDARLLGDAFDYMREHTGLPILGVVPYLRGHGLPEEDSVTFKEDLHSNSENPAGAASDGAQILEIVFIDLPFVSNFTDVDALRIEPDVRVRVLPVGASPDQIGAADAIVLPGTKNSLADLDYLKRQGLADRLVDLAQRPDGPVVVGICGGYQMLGQSIRDAGGVESHRNVGASAGVSGLGLLPVSTEFAPEKTLRQTRRRHRESGLEVFGYEVHHGQTTGFAPGARAFFSDDSEGASGGLGVVRADGRVWGTYLHGVFDADEFRRWFLDGLRERKGLRPFGRVQATFDLEPAFERVAAAVRENVELDTIYDRLGL
ncbi:MAG: cobyric acid synthase [bacterium]|nr:cobyric acid synthase [bacterium]